LISGQRIKLSLISIILEVQTQTHPELSLKIQVNSGDKIL